MQSMIPIGHSKQLLDEQFGTFLSQSSVAAGGVVLVVGPPGSGRKTLARAIAAKMAPRQADSIAHSRSAVGLRWTQDHTLLTTLRGILGEFDPNGIPGVVVVEAPADTRRIPIFLAEEWELEGPAGLQRISDWTAALTAHRPGAWFIATLPVTGDAPCQPCRSLPSSPPGLLVLRTQGYWERADISAFLEAQLGNTDSALVDALWVGSGDGETRPPGVVAGLLMRWKARGLVVQQNKRWGLAQTGGLLGRLRKRPTGPSWTDLAQARFQPLDADQVRVMVLAACGGDLIPLEVLGHVVNSGAVRAVTTRFTQPERNGVQLWQRHGAGGGHAYWTEPAFRESLTRLAHAQFIWSLQAERDCKAAIEHLQQMDIRQRARWATTEAAWQEFVRASGAPVEALPQTGDAEMLAFLTWLRWGPRFDVGQLRALVIRLDAMFEKMGHATAAVRLWRVALEHGAMPEDVSREQAQLRLARWLLELGRAAQAEQHLRALLAGLGEPPAASEEEPTDASAAFTTRVHLLIIRALLDQGNVEAAEAACGERNVALMSTADQSELRRLLGLALLDLGQASRAETVLADALQDQILAQAPVLMVARTREALGRTLLVLRRPEEARPIFERVLWEKVRSGGLPASVAITRYHLAETQARLARPDKAAETAEDAMAVLIAEHKELSDACAHPHRVQLSANRLLRNLRLM